MDRIPLRSPDASTLMDLIADAGVSEATVSATLGAPLVDIVSHRGLYSVLKGHKLAAADDARAVLIASLILGCPVPRRHLTRVLGLTEVAFLTSAGALQPLSEWFIPTVALTPLEDYVLFSDPLFINHPSTRRLVMAPRNATMPPHASTVSLLAYIRRQEDAGGVMLDIGCGCGALGIILTKSFVQSVGYDRSARAIQWSKLNCSVNKVSGVSVEVNDTLDETIPGRFDLALFNSPWVLNLPSHGPTAAHTSDFYAFLRHHNHRLLTGTKLTVSVVLGIRTTLEHEISIILEQTPPGVDIHADIIDGSPFAVPSLSIRDRRAPFGGYLIDGSSAEAFFTAAAVDMVNEFVFAVVRIRNSRAYL